MGRGVPTALAVGVLLAAFAAEAQIVLPGRDGRPNAAATAGSPSSTCHARRYDAAHLSAHPAQTVTAMSLSLRPPSADGASQQGAGNHDFVLSLERRGRRGRLTTRGECSTRGDTIVCGVECDGGGFALKREATGSVLVDLTRFGRLRLGRSCDDEDGIEITPGRDDRLFRLEPAGVAQCALPNE